MRLVNIHLQADCWVRFTGSTRCLARRSKSECFLIFCMFKENWRPTSELCHEPHAGGLGGFCHRADVKATCLWAGESLMLATWQELKWCKRPRVAQVITSTGGTLAPLAPGGGVDIRKHSGNKLGCAALQESNSAHVLSTDVNNKQPILKFLDLI